MMSLLCIYREYEMQENKDDNENCYYSPYNELDLIHEKIGVFPNRYIWFINNTCLIYEWFRIVDSKDYYENSSDITVTKKTTSGLKFVNLSCNV